MAEPSSVETIRAAVDAILPGDGTLPSGGSLGIERHVVDLADGYLTGFADMIAALLNAYATERGATAFADLDATGRIEVLRAMASEDVQDLRDAADAVFVFAYGGMYSEWAGYDRAAGTLQPPQAWQRTGYHGPSDGHPSYREAAP
ncbi:MAG TPA: gluconate 2-dehydrogenase subunit 3 family protein [Actinomycetota bacterium]|nr:gluconate 2-dehydrogenase subunit 3 family protein [Actinomycetota bacterium]